ncbi:MAG: DUF952 domain-containing protein [Chloroflexia bacterium]|nr:DUF952 domain-containing protein [Chloroflexia bacterium]
MSLIYHLVTTTRWQHWPSDQAYLPAEYATDGFVHCTAGDELMIAVANRFYQQVAGDFLLLVIDSERLMSPLKWEAPSPGDTLAPRFPHIYGPINRDAVVATKTITRASDGRFLTIVS